MERWKIWVRFRDRSGKIVRYGLYHKDYAHKCSAVRRAVKMYSVPQMRCGNQLHAEWIVAQENPWPIQAETYAYICAIIDKFEMLLDWNDVTIPDDWREGNDDESRIYGCTYHMLSCEIEEIILKLLDQFSRPQIIATPYLND